MLDPSKLYTPNEIASYLKVALGSIYQSVPSAACRSKVGRKKLPEPIRLGRLIRWSGQQINDFVSQLATAPKVEALVPAIPKRKAGRPRKNLMLRPDQVVNVGLQPPAAEHLEKLNLHRAGSIETMGGE